MTQTMKVYPDPNSTVSSNVTAKNGEIQYCAVTSPCEDIWCKFDDFLLTPPQSPPVEIENMFTTNPSTDDLFNLALDDFFEETNCLSDSSLVEVIDSFENDVLNDCMWSGPSLEEFAHLSDPSTCKNRKNDTQLLGTSPLGMSFGEILTCDDVEIEDEDDDSNDVPVVRDDASSSSCVESTSSGFVSGTESLIDHSYGSPKCTAKTSSAPTTSAQSKFLTTNRSYHSFIIL